MNIHTLTHIHALLIEEEKSTMLAVREARKRWLDADEAGSPDTPQLGEAATELSKKHTRSFNALQDFEAHEW